MTGAGVGVSVATANPQVYGGNMTITGDNDRRLWCKPKGLDNMEYLKFSSVVNLDITGSIPMSKLVANKSYKGVFEVKFANDASGWDANNPVTIEVSGPGLTTLRSTHNIVNAVSLSSASFTAPASLAGNLTFRLYQKSGVVKKGIIIKGFIAKKV